MSGGGGGGGGGGEGGGGGGEKVSPRYGRNWFVEDLTETATTRARGIAGRVATPKLRLAIIIPRSPRR